MYAELLRWNLLRYDFFGELAISKFYVIASSASFDSWVIKLKSLF